MVAVGAEDASDNTGLVVVINGVRDSFQRLSTYATAISLLIEDCSILTKGDSVSPPQIRIPSLLSIS